LVLVAARASALKTTLSTSISTPKVTLSAVRQASPGNSARWAAEQTSRTSGSAGVRREAIAAMISAGIAPRKIARPPATITERQLHGQQAQQRAQQPGEGGSGACTSEPRRCPSSSGAPSRPMAAGGVPATTSGTPAALPVRPSSTPSKKQQQPTASGSAKYRLFAA